MKIRKTFVGNLPDNKIVNSNSTSETDTYSCKYLNERNVIVSSEEPTTGEEVWLEKGKNLFDKRLLVSGGWDDSSKTTRVVWGMKIKAGITYTLTNYSSKRISAFETSNLEQSSSSNSVLVEHGAIDGNGSLTFTTQNDTYLRLLFSNIDNSNISVNDIISSNIQLEQGTTATSYEPYITKKIHTKTDNGYEEFYNEEEHNKVVLFEGTLLGGESIQLDGVKRYMDVYFCMASSDYVGALTGKYIIDTSINKNLVCGSIVMLCHDDDSGLAYYVSESNYDKSNKTFTHKRTGFFNISTGVYSGRTTGAYRVYRIETYD